MQQQDVSVDYLQIDLQKQKNVLICTEVQGVSVCAVAKRKERKTPPPVRGLISSHKQAASSARGLRDKKAAIELHNPSPGLRQCHKVSHDWLNKNTKSVPAGHLGHAAPPLKGRPSYFLCVRVEVLEDKEPVIHGLGMLHFTG